MLFKTDPMDAVEGVLKKRNWKYLRLDGDTIVTGVAFPPARMYSLCVRHDGERKTVVFLCSLMQNPLDALKALASGQPPVLRVHTNAGHTSQQVAGVCDLLLHLNYGMLLGGFERDQTDGEVRFRVALPYRDSRLSADQADWCIDIAMISSDNGMRQVEELLKGSLGAGTAGGGKIEV